MFFGTLILPAMAISSVAAMGANLGASSSLLSRNTPDFYAADMHTTAGRLGRRSPAPITTSAEHIPRTLMSDQGLYTFAAEKKIFIRDLVHPSDPDYENTRLYQHRVIFEGPIVPHSLTWPLPKTAYKRGQNYYVEFPAGVYKMRNNGASGPKATMDFTAEYTMPHGPMANEEPMKPSR